MFVEFQGFAGNKLQLQVASYQNLEKENVLGCRVCWRKKMFSLSLKGLQAIG